MDTWRSFDHQKRQDSLPLRKGREGKLVSSGLLHTHLTLSLLTAGVYERTLSVDGEDTTLVVMDTWEAEKLVRTG